MIVVDGSNVPHVAYYNNDPRRLRYGNRAGGSWSLETVEATVGGNPVGAYPSIALDSSGNPSIAYVNSDYDGVRYANWNGASWDIETVVGNPALTYGSATALLFDSSGNPHVLFGVSDNGHIKHAAWNGASWDIETAVNIGAFSALGLDAAIDDDLIHVAYIDDANDDLGYAVQDGVGGWDAETVDSDGYTGLCPTIVVDDGDPSIAYSRNSGASLSYATTVAPAVVTDEDDTPMNVYQQESGQFVEIYVGTAGLTPGDLDVTICRNGDEGFGASDNSTCDKDIGNGWYRYEMGTNDRLVLGGGVVRASDGANSGTQRFNVLPAESPAESGSSSSPNPDRPY
jgi:hypothetical protein